MLIETISTFSTALQLKDNTGSFWNPDIDIFIMKNTIHE